MATSKVLSLALSNGVPPGALFGLTLSTAGSSQVFGIAAGSCADSTGSRLIRFGSAYTKTAVGGGTWTVGSGGSALDTGAYTTNTWYHVYAILRPDTGVSDFCLSLSASAPTLGTNIPAAYTLYRRIGSLRSGAVAGQWILFKQLGDEFLWDVPVQDVNTSTLSTTSTLFALTNVPLGVQVAALLRGYMSNASANTDILLTSPDESVQAVATPAGNYTARNPNGGAAFPFVPPPIRTNTSQQIRAVGDTASTSLVLLTYGWIDTRGRNA